MDTVNIEMNSNRKVETRVVKFGDLKASPLLERKSIATKLDEEVFNNWVKKIIVDIESLRDIFGNVERLLNLEQKEQILKALSLYEVTITTKVVIQNVDNELPSVKDLEAAISNAKKAINLPEA